MLKMTLETKEELEVILNEYSAGRTNQEEVIEFIAEKFEEGYQKLSIRGDYLW